MQKDVMTHITPLDDKGIAQAVKLLVKGDVVAFPTETVYGLGADATNDKAVAKIYEAKGRPSFNPLIIHVPNIKTAERYVEIPPLGHKLADSFWPGAMTLVCKRKPNAKVSKLVSAGLDTVAVRIPAHGGARDLLRAIDRPVAAPSANRSGQLSPSKAQHVKTSLEGRIPLILDGGECHVGVESSIIDISSEDITLLRPGGISVEAIEAIIGHKVKRAVSDDFSPKAPGMLSSHYAPNAKIFLNATHKSDNEIYIAFGPSSLLDRTKRETGFEIDFNLSEAGDTTEAAANLFTLLHEADKKAHALYGDKGKIAIAPIPESGLGLAINDRLARAAAPRPKD